MKAIKKPVELECFTFHELIEYGHKFINENPTEGNYGPDNNLPWSFKLKDFSITHENDECYIVPSSLGFNQFFTRNDILIVTPNTGLQVVTKEEFYEAFNVIQLAPNGYPYTNYKLMITVTSLEQITDDCKLFFEIGYYKKVLANGNYSPKDWVGTGAFERIENVGDFKKHLEEISKEGRFEEYIKHHNLKVIYIND